MANNLTDAQCDTFRRLPMSFNDMVREIYAEGAKSAEKPIDRRKHKPTVIYIEGSSPGRPIRAIVKTDEGEYSDTGGTKAKALNEVFWQMLGGRLMHSGKAGS